MNHQLLHELAGRTWAMDRPRLENILRVVRADGAMPIQAARQRSAVRSGNVAIIPIHGVIDRRDSFLLEIFGGTSVDAIRANFRDALADTGVSGIVFLMDSPGGVVDGVPEMADEIFKARGRKPMVAVVDTMCCSAAMWLASQADEMVVPRYSSYTGSVGVYAEHEDYSKMLDEVGITVTLISAGEGKTDGNPYEPLSDRAKSDMQKRVDEVYGWFVDAVARGRGVKAATVRGEWKAACYGSKEAVRLGLVDRVGSLDEAVSRVGSGRVKMRAAAAGGTLIAGVAADATEAAADAELLRAAHADLLASGVPAAELEPVLEVHEHASTEVIDAMREAGAPETDDQAADDQAWADRAAAQLAITTGEPVQW